MSDISNQLIKDSYDYVLQSDLSTGIVYRIGGGIPVNPTFLSGLTINSTFTFADGSEQNGYVLTSDASGNASWKPVSAATPSSGVTSITVGNGLSANSSTGAVTIVFTGSTGISGDYLPLSGGTVTGDTIFESGLTATTISATTYYNLPVSAVTSGTGISASTNNGTATITNTLPDKTVVISGGTNIEIVSDYPNFGINYTGQTTFDYLSLSGGTVSGDTIFQSGLTATTISATTYYGITNPTSFYIPVNSGGTFQDSILYQTGNTLSLGTTSNTVGGYGGDIVIQGNTSNVGAGRIIVGGTGYYQDLIFTKTNASGVQKAWSFGNRYDEYFGNSIGSFQIVGVASDDTLFVPLIAQPNGDLVLVGATENATNGNLGVGIMLPTNKLHVSASTDPVRFEGITAATDNDILSIDSTGVVHTYSLSGLTGWTTALENYLPLSGGTVSGDTIFESGLTATTISATTYLNVNAVTGGSYSNGTITLSGTGNVNGNLISGFTKYFVSASTPTGATITIGDRWYNTNNGIELVYISDGDSSQWVQPSNTPGPPGYSNLMITTGITTSAATLDININYYGVNYNGQVNLTLPNPSGYDGYNMTIKDEGGYCGTYRIRLTPVSGTIDGNNYVDMNLNYIGLHLLARNNNWWVI